MSNAMADAKTIFLDALECKGAEELARFLEQACGADSVGNKSLFPGEEMREAGCTGRWPHSGPAGRPPWCLVDVSSVTT